jgi:signal transduction histidine kinase
MTKDGAGPLNPAQLVSTMFTLIPVPIAVVDSGGKVVIANSCFNEVFSGVSSISGMPEHELEVPGFGTLQLVTLPLNDCGLRLFYGLDVSNEIQLRRQVRHLEKMAAVGRVVTDVAQELTGPLEDVAGCAAVARRAGLDPEAAKIAERAFASAQRAAAVIQSLLVLTAPGIAKSGEVDVNALVRSALERHAGGSSVRNCEVFLDLDDQLPKVPGDPVQIEQVIETLLIRAESAEPGTLRRRVIQIQTRTGEKSVQLHVSDNGVPRDGFEPEQSGIGLNVCAEIVREHGGELYAWRKHGSGSTLTMELPAVTVRRRGQATP